MIIIMINALLAKLTLCLNLLFCSVLRYLWAMAASVFLTQTLMGFPMWS